MSDYFGNTKKGIFDLSDDYQEGVKPFIWCFVVALAVITICSGSSFLYVFIPLNDTKDSFSVGKSIFGELVPYRDMYAQKGIMLYFIYGLASLISIGTFRGVFVMEILAAFFSMLAILKTYQLFLEPRSFPYILTPITGAVIYSAFNFSWGGSAEEFVFPFTMWGVYLSLRYFKSSYPDSMDYKTVLLTGILAGCVLNIRINPLVFFLGWMLMVFIADIIGERNVTKAVISCFVFLGGVITATIPWFIYLGVNHAIDDWFRMYFYKSVFEPLQRSSIGERMAVIGGVITDNCMSNKVIFIFVALGIVYFIASGISSLLYEDRNSLVKRNRVFVDVSVIELVNILVLFVFLGFGLFIGGADPDLSTFPINGFVMFGFIPFCYIIEKFLKSRIERNTHGRNYDGAILEASLAFAISIVSFLVSIVVAWLILH